MKSLQNLISLLCLILISFNSTASAADRDVEFGHVGIRDGLSNSQVNTIFKDSRGYVWIGTQSGLNRYDGYRFKTYFYKSTDSSSLPNNWISAIQETAEHTLLIKTPGGYTSFYPETETFSYDPASWMARHNLKGSMDRVFVDKQKNYVVVSNDIGINYIHEDGTVHLFRFGKELPKGQVKHITQHGRSILLTYSNGRLVSFLPSEHRVAWVSDYIPQHRQSTDDEDYRTYVSQFSNYWVTANGQTWLYNQKRQKWYDNLSDYLREGGYSPVPDGQILIKDIVEDQQGRMWIATEHRGLFRIDYHDYSVYHYEYDADDSRSVADNTIQSLYLDPSGDLWVGTYKNGLSFYSPNAARFNTVPVGDVCTITEDTDGNYWCGTNDQSIVVYNHATGTTRNYSNAETGLGSNVVVSSTRMKDGTLWFGAFNGGMASYSNGQWRAFRASDGSGLANDNVWALCSSTDGRLVIGTLGAGVQVYNPRNGKFETYNTQNSELASDYINSVSLMHDNRILVAHSNYFSAIDLRTHKVVNFNPKIAKGAISSPAINQAIEDSRGIIWLATASGGCAYDPRTHQLAELDWTEGSTGSVSCSAAEDKQGSVWLVGDHGAARIEVRKGEDEWEFYSEAFNEHDGLQKRQFNFRSILSGSDGDIVLGGQDGINIIPTKTLIYKETHARVLFSGLRIFDTQLSTGDEYNGHVVLERDMDDSHELRLRHDENVFTILLASNEVTIPATTRFTYRLVGFSDKWFMTPQGSPSITLTNLSPGSYTLQVKAVMRNGAISTEMNTLHIYIAPPFYRTWLAYIIYVLIAVTIVLLVRRRLLRRQLERLRIQHMKEEAAHNREMNEMKLNFFTNVSHELRTPLTLIVSPLATMMRQEKDAQKRERLSLIHRNAQRLFELVNQLLDFRKMDQKKQKLELVTADIVAFVRNIVNDFQLLSSREVSLTFSSDLERLSMSFDPDKLQKVVTNLLGNAFKYTPSGGHVDVTLAVKLKALNGEDAVCITVADTGEGVPDEDKTHIFEPFFQASNHTSNPYGGSGVGLSLVKDFAELHDGTVSVTDREGGGSCFEVQLPVRHDASLSHLTVEQPPELTCDDDADEETAAKVSKPKGRRSEVLLVDDAEDFLTFMTEVLSERYKVRTAHDGQEALERIAEQKPDIILSDVMMPRLDGRELCRRLKANEETAAIPFIMLTARIADTHMVEGMQLGADDYLTKPFNMEVLFLRIENLLKWHHQATDKQPLIEPEVQEVEVTDMDKKFVQTATEYVESHLEDTDMTVETLAAEIGVSRVQLYRRLLSLTGSTPTEFIRDIRLRHAEQLLRSGQLSVSEVAYRVGFNNPRYFSKYFSEKYGTLPSQYSK